MGDGPVSRQEEHENQAMVVEYLRLRGIGVCSIPNGASLGTRRGVDPETRAKVAAIQMNYLKAEGLEVGAPDLIIRRLCRCCSSRRPIVVEMKSKKGKRSAEQESVHADYIEEGWHVLTCDSFAEFMRDAIVVGL